MTTPSRLDRLIVRLCYVRNLLTKNSDLDFDIDLHPAESEINTLYEAALTAEEKLNDNARD